MEREKTRTRIVFGNDEEIRDRRSRTRQFHNANVRSYLLGDEYEMSKTLTDLMVIEGMSDSFIDDLLCRETDESYAATLDYLHAAALIMGETYVRENLLGTTTLAADASEKIRMNFHETQLSSYREIYENLDEKIRAAIEGETKVDHQIEILRIQSENASKMYQQKMQSTILQHEYEIKLERAEHEMEKQKLREKLGKMEALLKQEKDRARDLEREMGELAGRMKENGRLRRLLCYFKRAGDNEPSAQGKEEADRKESPDSGERRLFCYSVLGNKNFTPQQIEVLLPCLKDESIPLVILKKLCTPDLPLQNMKSFIRYIRKDDSKNED